MTKQQLPVPLRLLAALVIGAGCALYAPFAPLRLSALTAVSFLLTGCAGFLLTGGLAGRLHRRLVRFALPLSFCLALSFVLGEQLQVYGTLALRPENALTLAGFWALWFFLLCHLFVTVPAWLKPARPQKRLHSTPLLWSVCLSFCVLAASWLFAFYPIMTNYDIHAHLLQLVTGQYETHHSLLYTLLIQGLLRLSSALGFANAWAFLVLGLIQMAVMALSIGYGLISLNAAGADRRAVIAAAVYYCLFPLFGYFAFSTTKDTLFACFILLTAIELYRLSCESGGVWSRVRMALFATLACLMRYNGAATLILLFCAVVVLALYRLARHIRLSAMMKRMLILLPVMLALATGAGALLSLATGAVTPETVNRDKLSLPLQQMARVLLTAQDEADIARIEGLFGVEDIRERYRPDISDPVKAAFLYPDENVVNALRAWLKIGVKYPKAYLEAFLELTRGAWFTDDLSHTKIDFWLSYTGYLETTQKYQETAIPIAYHTAWPALRAFWERTFMDNRYLNVPMLRYLFALGVQTWTIVIALCYAAYHRRRHAMRLLLFALCVLLPLFLLPCMISRYFLPLFLLNPLCLLAITTRKENATA